MRHLLSTADLSLDEATSILDVAEEMQQVQGRSIKKLPTLRGRTIINAFFEDSTRTRTSFEMAGKWLSADTINISGKGSSVSKGESLRDTMQVLDAMGTDCFVIRHSSSGAVAQAAGWVEASVVNAGDGANEHPTQALLDAFTMRHHYAAVGEPGFEGKHVVIVGDLLHSRVVRSNVHLQKLLGGHVTLVAPPTLLPTGVDTWGVDVTQDFDQVVGRADVVMMLRVQRERMSSGFFPTAREYSEHYGLTVERLAKLGEKTAIMHPGPINRGVEMSSQAADAAASRVLDQVAAGVAIRMSVLYHLLGGEGADK